MADDEGTTGTTEQAEPDTSTTEELGDAGKRALDAERTRAKEAERRAKTLERELEQLRTSQLSESERAVAEAKAAGRTEVLAEVGARMARSEMRAAAARAGLDIDGDLDYLDMARFVGDDGEPSEREIAKYIATRAESQPRGTSPGLAQGARSTASGGDMNSLIRQAAGRG